MRKIIISSFVTMDGVMQAPGGPKEDTDNGFKYGGWSFSYWDQMMGEVMTEMMSQPYDLLLGRRTYDIFAAYWPSTDKPEDQPVKEKFTAIKKYVVSRSPRDFTWENSALITGDVVEQIKALKNSGGPDLSVQGSSNLIQTLLANNLADRIITWTFPVTVGGGKRLFEPGVPAQSFKLIDSKTSSTGVIIASYEPAGQIKLGSFAD